LRTISSPIRRRTPPRTGRSALHAKIHAGFIAEFQVLADLPEHARHGVFAAPRTAPIKFGPYAVKFIDTPGARNHGNDRSSFDE
jgi:hypothetical protein